MRRGSVVWNRGLQFVGTSGSNHAIVVDASTEGGGYGAGPSNTELVLIALCACTGMDVVSILKKKRLRLEDMEISAEGEVKEEPPKHFTKIHITYRVWGEVPERAIEEAIRLSQEKYCTVSLSLKGRADVTYEYHINPER